jgi:hypothetical protein
MRQIIFPLKDASIYEELPNRNTGLDEILEIGKSETVAFRIRSLANFVLPSGLPINAEFDLQLFTANAEKGNRNQLIRVAAQSQSWEEGDGYFYQDRIQSVSGATWTDANSGSLWAITGSIPNGAQQVSGTYAPSPDNKDFRIDVTTLVRQAISASVNPSLVIALTETDELEQNVKTNIKFFSKDTHTIYKPMLVAKWNDQTFVTGTLAPLTALEIHVQPRSLKPVYKVGEVATVFLNARAKYPLKTFAMTASLHDGQAYLPASSSFSIVDEQTNLEIIPFDNYSKISCVANGSYCKFRVEGMYPLRYYRLRFKIEFADGRVEVIDDNYIFTVSL